MTKILPLFPLPIAVLPGQRIPLHIFEDSYKQLMAEAIEDNNPKEGNEFGINFISSNGLAAIGCTISIVQVLKNSKNGRLDLIAEGKRRFRLLEIIEGKPYQEGKIEYLDEVDAQASPLDSQRFLELHNQMRVVVGMKSAVDFSKPQLSFQSSVSMGLGDFEKQTLLELASEQDRVAWLIELYEAILNEVKSGKKKSFAGEIAYSKSGQDPGLQRIH